MYCAQGHTANEKHNSSQIHWMPDPPLRAGQENQQRRRGCWEGKVIEEDDRDAEPDFERGKETQEVGRGCTVT